MTTPTPAVGDLDRLESAARLKAAVSLLEHWVNDGRTVRFDANGYLIPEHIDAINDVLASHDDLTARATTAEALAKEQAEEIDALREFYHADKAVRDVGRMNSTAEQDVRLDRARAALRTRPSGGDADGGVG
jgi:hypothetical protein